MLFKRAKAEKSKPVRTRSKTRLCEAVLRSDYDEMRRLIKAGDELNEFDGWEMTPLLWAIMRADIEAVRMLLESGADPNVRPNRDDSPLWSAEEDFGLEEIASLLRSYGATR